jgi:hypothetical protein
MANSYDKARTRDQLRRMDRTIDAFLDRFCIHAAELGGDQKTVIFLPGGMASELARAGRAFDPQVPGAALHYATLWLDLLQIFVLGRATRLRMNGDEDHNRRIVVADGPMANCFFEPYDDFAWWCNHHGLDALVVGWDWRRDPAKIVAFLLQDLVPHIRARAAARGCPDPLARLSLVGHSFGGMIVKWLLNEIDAGSAMAGDIGAGLQHAVTVGTPFYGYGGQTHRYFKGEPELGEETYRASELARTIATMQGGYALLFLDWQTWRDHEDGLRAGQFPAPRYPSRDAATGEPADPYNPAAGPKGTMRYPTWVKRPMLDRGRELYRELARPFRTAGLAGRFHTIRAVQQRDGQVLNDTVVSQKWGWIDRDFDPDARNARFPVEEEAGDFGPGDGTIPAWSARHLGAGTAPTVIGDLEHGALMDDQDVRRVLLRILRPQEAEAAEDVQPMPNRPEIATDAEFAETMSTLAALGKAGDPRRVRAYVSAMSHDKRRRLARHFLMRLARGPVTPRPRAKDKGR